MSIYAAIDTNVVLSALLSKREDAATVKVMNAVFDGRIIPLLHQGILDEYNDVLHRTRFHLADHAIDAVISDFSRMGIHISPGPVQEALPDPDDMVFYAVVMEKRKTDDAYLVTGNLRHFPCQTYVVTPAEMIAILDAKSGE